MKRFVTYLALLAMLANSAMAGVVVNSTKIGTSGNGFDVWEVKISGYTGADDVANNTISGIEGTFTATSGSMSFTGATVAAQKNNASNVLMGGGTGSGQTDGTGGWVNFDSFAGTFARTGGATTATALQATWFTTDNTLRLRPVDTTVGGTDDGFDQTLLAQIFLTPGGAANFAGKINTSAVVGGAFSFNIGGGVGPVTDPIAVTTTPANGTSRTPGQTVAVANAAAAGGNSRDSAALTNVAVTGSGFSQTGMSNGAIAPGGSQTATIAFDKGTLLNGYQPTGSLGFTVGSGPSGAGTGAGNYAFPLTAPVITGQTGNGSAPVAAGGSFAALSSTSALVSAPPQIHLPSTATILGGTNSVGGATTVTMTWSLRNANEQFPGASPPLPVWANALTSDKVDLTGTDGDLFVLQMTYDPSVLTGNEADDQNKGHLFLASFDGTNWVNAVSLNHGAASPQAVTNFKGSWAAAGSTLALGSWGSDIAANTVWAVLDHNSLFASVPEPSTILIGLMGLVGLVGFARRRRG